VELADGTTHLLLAADVENVLETAPSFPECRTMIQADWGVRTDAEFCTVCRDANGNIGHLTFCNGSFIEVGNTKMVGDAVMGLADVAFEAGAPRIFRAAANPTFRIYRDGVEIAGMVRRRRPEAGSR